MYVREHGSDEGIPVHITHLRKNGLSPVVFGRFFPLVEFWLTYVHDSRPFLGE